MLSAVKDRSKVAALLLCALIAVMSIVSPICPACDELGNQPISHVHIAGKALPHASDDCNGVCSCCGFDWLPSMQTQLPAVAIVTTVPVSRNEHYPSRFTPPPFLPPRA